uniref:PGM_PMM_III domain-containing protein n=1 Tax=Anisakis simplex TaxID=6269 RepID=A0A0M3JCK4_ANISI
LAEKQADGEWKVFAGNEMGALISWWTWKSWKKENPNGDASNLYMLNSAVSSSIVKTMATKEGFKNELTLTGFKWMGNKADELTKQGKHVILAWEESIGFMAGNPLDKDGVTAAGIFAEMASYLHSENLTLAKQLFNIYKELVQFIDSLSFSPYRLKLSKD